MSSVYLQDHEVDKSWLPRVCVRCGEQSTCFRTETLTWMPTWKFVVSTLMFGLGTTIMASSYETKVDVSLPFCRKHKNHWRWRRQALAGLKFSVLVLIFGGLALDFTEMLSETVSYKLLLVAILASISWVWLTVASFLTEVRLADVSGSRIDLAGVSSQFVAAVEARRAAERRERRLRPEATMKDQAVDVWDTYSEESSPRVKYQVVGLPTGGGAKRVIGTFDEMAKAQAYAEFLKNAGSFRDITVKESTS